MNNEEVAKFKPDFVTPQIDYSARMPTSKMYTEMTGMFNTDALVKYCWEQIAEPSYGNSWYTLYYFQMLNLNKQDVFEACPMLAEVDKHTPIKGMGITLMSPGFYYKLHTDHGRGVCFNMLLNTNESITAYVTPPTAEHIQGETFRLKYNLNEMYLFNTQVPHTVFNFVENRYMFTVEFHENKELLTYRGLKKRLKQQGLIGKTTLQL